MDEKNLITPYLSSTDELNPFVVATLVHTVGIPSSLHPPLSFSGQTAVLNGCNPSFDHAS
jgi:hypothetical protein